MEKDLVSCEAKLYDKNRLYINKELRRLFENNIGLCVCFRLDEENGILHIQKPGPVDFKVTYIKRDKGKTCSRLQLPIDVIKFFERTGSKNELVLIIENEESSGVTFKITHKTPSISSS